MKAFQFILKSLSVDRTDPDLARSQRTLGLLQHGDMLIQVGRIVRSRGTLQPQAKVARSVDLHTVNSEATE